MVLHFLICIAEILFVQDALIQFLTWSTYCHLGVRAARRVRSRNYSGCTVAYRGGFCTLGVVALGSFNLA